MSRRRRFSPGGAAVALIAVAIAVPVLAVALRAVRPDDAWGLEALGRVLGSPRTWRVAAVTVAQAAASALITLVVGVPAAVVLARYRFLGARALATVAIVPFVLPSVVIGTAFSSLLGAQGPLDLRGTWWPILAAHLSFNLAVVLRTVGAALSSLDPEVEAAARVLGATPAQAIRRVALPLVAPAVAAAGVVVFLFCLTSFGVIVILGGGAVTTLEVEIWTRATRQFDLSGAAVLGMVQLAAVLATLGVQARLARRRTTAVRPAPGRARRRRVRTVPERLAVVGTTLLVLVASVLPLAALVERSLRVPGGWGLANWRSLGSVTAGTSLRVAPSEAVVVSLLTASVAATLAVLLALPAARVAARRPGGLADRVALAPLGVSATTIGLGLLLAFGRPPVDLRRSWWLVPAAQALIALPLVVRAVLPAMRSRPGVLDDAAATLGAAPGRRWWEVELPLLRRPLVAGAGLGLIACLGEFGATVFLARSGRPTMPVAIERLMSRPGGAGLGQAMALACLLALLCAVVLWAVDRAAVGRDGVDMSF